jgi:general stress protein 26
MKPEIIDYLKEQRVGVLAVEMPDGSPHAATLHFAHSEEPLVLYFGTGIDSVKMKSFIDKSVVRASYVIGQDENTMKTLQMDGVLEIINSDQREVFESVYLEKYPDRKERLLSPKSAALRFTPKWWRYSDMKQKIVLVSE